MATNLFFPLNGGSEHVIYETSRRLVERGHEVHVLTERTKEEWPLEDSVEGIQIHRCPVRFDSSLRRFSSGIMNAARLFRTLNASKPFDLLHFHLTMTSTAVLLCRASKRIARISTFHGPWHTENLIEQTANRWWQPGQIKASVFKKMQKYVLTRSDQIVVLSRFSKSLLDNLIGSDTPSVRIPGGADLERFQPAPDRDAVRQRLGLAISAKVLLTVRRLVPRMGIDALIGAMPGILKVQTDAILVVCGTGPMRKGLEQLAKDLGVSDSIVFKGYIPDELLPLYYQAADLFILPTRALEGFGLSTVEALACGTPVAGTSIGATAEILSDLDARFLIPESTPKAISDTTLACIETACDSHFRSRCRTYAEDNYDWEQIVNELENVYTAALRSS
jgi:glycosyltransferase involved in cell wall biosynthesis